MHLGSVRTQPAVASLAEPHRERITRWWRQGVQGTTIHGAPVRSHGFTGSYSSVRRFLAGVQAPETLQGAFLGIVAGNRRGQPFRRGPVYGFAGGRPVGDEACGRGFHPVPSMGQLLEFVEEGAEGVAAIVSPYPDGGVVQSQGAVATSSERVRVEIRYDVRTQNTGDPSRQTYEGRCVSKRDSLAHHGIDLILHGQVEQLSGNDR